MASCIPKKKYDEYMTPFSAWKEIEQYIPKDKIIWEAFYGDGVSGANLIKLGCKEVIAEDIDFFVEDRGEVIISNPPFSEAKRVLIRLKELDKPFILIMPCSKISTRYFRETFHEGIQLIIPKKRIQFIKLGEQLNTCSFDCFYYCYKMKLPKDINFIL